MSSKVEFHMRSGKILVFSVDQFKAVRSSNNELIGFEGTNFVPEWLYISLKEVEAILEK